MKTTTTTKTNFPPSIWCAGRELKLTEIFNEKETPNWADLYGNNPVFKHEGNFHALYQ